MAVVIGSLAGTSSAREAIELTLYRTRVDGAQDAALGPPGVRLEHHAAVRELRNVTLRAGINRIRLGRLPATVAPGSLRIRAAPGALRVLSVRLLGPREWPAKERAARGMIAVELDTGQTISGVVAASSSAFTALRDGGATLLVPGSIIEKVRAGTGTAAIELVIEASRAGRYPLELRYQAGSIRWDLAYTAIRDGDRVELSGSIELENRSGAAFPGAAVALVDRAVVEVPVGLANGEAPSNAFEQRSAYAAGAVGVVAGESERPLAPAATLAAVEVLIYRAELDPGGGRFPRTSCSAFAQAPPSNRSTRALELRPGAGLMAALLPGSVRLLERTPSGRLSPAAEGELEIDRRSRVARIAIGRSNAISGRRHQVSCELDAKRRRLRETVELEIANDSSEDAVVLVRVPMNRWHNHLVVSESIAGADHAEGREYRIEVGAASTGTLRYTADYYW